PTTVSVTPPFLSTVTRPLVAPPAVVPAWSANLKRFPLPDCHSECGIVAHSSSPSAVESWTMTSSCRGSMPVNPLEASFARRPKPPIGPGCPGWSRAVEIAMDAVTWQQLGSSKSHPPQVSVGGSVVEVVVVVLAREVVVELVDVVVEVLLVLGLVVDVVLAVVLVVVGVVVEVVLVAVVVVVGDRNVPAAASYAPRSQRATPSELPSTVRGCPR